MLEHEVARSVNSLTPVPPVRHVSGPILDTPLVPQLTFAVTTRIPLIPEAQDPNEISISTPVDPRTYATRLEARPNTFALTESTSISTVTR